MESSYLVVFSVVAGALLLLSVLTTLIYWARLSAVVERQDELARVLHDKAPQKQIEKAVVVSEGTRDRLDTALLELEKYRQGIHGEMQRFYGIMRRNEKSAAIVSAQDGGGESAPELPDEISAEDLKPSAEEEAPISKAQLRKQARDAGL